MQPVPLFRPDHVAPSRRRDRPRRRGGQPPARSVPSVRLVVSGELPSMLLRGRRLLRHDNRTSAPAR
jgi:hypothetical protein